MKVMLGKTESRTSYSADWGQARGGFIEGETLGPCCKVFCGGVNGTDSWDMHEVTGLREDPACPKSFCSFWQEHRVWGKECQEMSLDNYTCSRLSRSFFETLMSLNYYHMANGGKTMF